MEHPTTSSGHEPDAVIIFKPVIFRSSADAKLEIGNAPKWRQLA